MVWIQTPLPLAALAVGWLSPPRETTRPALTLTMRVITPMTSLGRDSFMGFSHLSV
jgi:hypothetical protein